MNDKSVSTRWRVLQGINNYSSVSVIIKSAKQRVIFHPASKLHHTVSLPPETSLPLLDMWLQLTSLSPSAGSCSNLWRLYSSASVILPPEIGPWYAHQSLFISPDMAPVSALRFRGDPARQSFWRPDIRYVFAGARTRKHTDSKGGAMSRSRN